MNTENRSTILLTPGILYKLGYSDAAHGLDQAHRNPVYLQGFRDGEHSIAEFGYLDHGTEALESTLSSAEKAYLFVVLGSAAEKPGFFATKLAACLLVC